ncbi:hypothetical protein [Paenibacillus humicus]|uniref:hypothetical protein n=1 Tax=Paenibacillus humicus TaxID=412861 RepID=UPI000FDA2834|nr:hypothetical protein [Paenibacillus humicus]
MGFIQSLTLDSGLDVPKAYIRAVAISGTVAELEVKVFYYASKAARLDGKPAFQVRTFRFAPSVAPGSTNYHRQFYEWAKGIEEFASAVDDLEP